MNNTLRVYVYDCGIIEGLTCLKVAKLIKREQVNIFFYLKTEFSNWWGSIRNAKKGNDLSSLSGDTVKSSEGTLSDHYDGGIFTGFAAAITNICHGHQNYEHCSS